MFTSPLRHVLRRSSASLSRPAALLVATLAASLAWAADEKTDSCGIRTVMDRIWDQPSCPSGVCRTLLLRSDGTYQFSMITIGSKTVFCESGQWQQEPGACGTMRLTPCRDQEKTRSWTIKGQALTFGESNFGVADSQNVSTAFIGCNVRRLCDGLSCGEYLGCLKDCSNDIVPDASCPSKCLERVSPSQQETARLQSCARKSSCSDGACLERSCAAEMQACVAK